MRSQKSERKHQTYRYTSRTSAQFLPLLCAWHFLLGTPLLGFQGPKFSWMQMSEYKSRMLDCWCGLENAFQWKVSYLRVWYLGRSDVTSEHNFKVHFSLPQIANFQTENIILFLILEITTVPGDRVFKIMERTKFSVLKVSESLEIGLLLWKVQQAQ